MCLNGCIILSELLIIIIPLFTSILNKPFKFHILKYETRYNITSKIEQIIGLNFSEPDVINIVFFVYKFRSYATSYRCSENERSILLTTDCKASRNMKLKKNWMLKQWARRSADQWQMAARPWDINDLVSDHSNNELIGMTDLVHNQHSTRCFNTTVIKRIRYFKINNLDVYTGACISYNLEIYTLYCLKYVNHPPPHFNF